ncbi:MAG: hypothetical protein LC102_06510 [Ignavibacteriales bacterium]|nr:hypothetical protein [Ignavibacteriaceae bacterium]MBW7873323.1 hypothetical protein [Ignavibacteria bacterium]MCZ2143060.1 hypothetical protein [Ignavibacteriales bacterium]OQY69886.1 MAG: hypothetical protein B6D45_12170 [Ignavibacteriales bacterium UTCHB3]MBZ0198071.1 hypothetical protein [Ignavibacteriaceae bacterium]
MCTNLRCEDFNLESNDLCSECNSYLFDNFHLAYQCPYCKKVWMVRDKFVDEKEYDSNMPCFICNEEMARRRADWDKGNRILRELKEKKNSKKKE